MDPEPPTRRLDPSAPPPGQPLGVGVPEEHLVHNELADRIRTLRTWLAVLGTLAAIALGVALWALLTKEEESDARRGATPASVQRLDDRVDSLENRIDERATKSSVAEVRGDQEQLGEQVEELSKQAANGGDTEEVEQSVEEVRGEVEQLEQRLDELAQDSEQQTP